MKNAQDIAKLADVISDANMGANSKLEAIKGELIARFSGAAPGGPIQFSHAATSTKPPRRRISPYEVSNTFSVVSGGAGSGNTGSTFSPLFSGLSSRINQSRTNAGNNLLVDVRLDDQDEGSLAGDELTKSALADYEAAQKRSSSLALTSSLVQTALASFKRLTQGQ